MKKIKIGVLGAAAFDTAKKLTLCCENAVLSAVVDTNRHKLDEVVKLSKEYGSYVKAYKNTDDFYQTEYDMVLASKDMYDYVRLANTYLTDGTYGFDEKICGVGATENDELYRFCGDKWKKSETKLSAEQNLLYMKNGKDPVFIYFFGIVN